MKIHTAALIHNKTGAHIQVSEYPLHALILEQVGDWLAGVPLHRVACCPPEFLYNIHWGQPETDPTTEDSDGDKWWPHNLGHHLHQVGTWMMTGFGTWRKEKTIAMVPVTPAWVREHYPSYKFPFDNSCWACLGYLDIDPHEPEDPHCQERQKLYTRVDEALHHRFNDQIDEILGTDNDEPPQAGSTPK